MEEERGRETVTACCLSAGIELGKGESGMIYWGKERKRGDVIGETLHLSHFLLLLFLINCLCDSPPHFLSPLLFQVPLLNFSSPSAWLLASVNTSSGWYQKRIAAFRILLQCLVIVDTWKYAEIYTEKWRILIYSSSLILSRGISFRT